MDATTQGSTTGEATATSDADAKRMAGIKALIKVGLHVVVENGMHEILVPAKVFAVTEEGFTVEARGRKTLSKWVDADFVQTGSSKPVLFDGNHNYTHVV